MDPILGGLITGGAGLLSSIFSSDTSAKNTQMQIAGQQQMQAQSQQFNAEQAQMNREFQQQMSSTAYQRSAADMKAAGLNPMMMFGSGGAASTPGGATASTGTPTMPTPQRTSALAGLGESVKSGLTAMITSKSLDKMSEEIANLTAENAKIKAHTDLLAATTTGQAQKNIINLPDETKAQLFNEWLRKHPQLVTAGEVGGYAGKKISETLAPAESVLNSAFKGYGLNLAKQKLGQGSTFTERFDAHKGGFTRSREEWPLNP